jgi:hypothetical protein
MTHLKTSFAIALLACFLSVKTNAQVSMNIDSVRKALSLSQQNYKANPSNNKPVSCVFATNAFRENDAFKQTSRSELPNANEPKSSNGKAPLTQFRTDNVVTQNEIYYIFSPKSEATILERTVTALLLFGQVW